MYPRITTTYTWPAPWQISYPLEGDQIDMTMEDTGLMSDDDETLAQAIQAADDEAKKISNGPDQTARYDSIPD